MKSMFKVAVSLILMSCFLLNSIPLFAQPEPVREPAAVAADLQPAKSEVLKAKVVAKKFDALLKVDEGIKALDTHLIGKGFLAQKEVKNFWGRQEIYKDKDKKLTYTVYLQDYIKKDSRDVVALGHVTLRVGDRSETYSFYLLAPNGNFEEMEEYQITKKLDILRANSWWSCVKARIKKKCPTVCLSALVTCLPTAVTVVGYVVCVAATCGRCALGSIACCSCDCGWTCSWAVGCCDR